MPRPPRIQFAGALLHVINRGNNKQDVFLDSDDFEYYLELLKRYTVKYSVSLFHFVLMTNHVHFLLEPSKEKTISKFMQGITLAYTKYFNVKYHRVGHVWQSRFKTILIEANGYYLRCARYIELNPVRANLVQKPEDYPWSSYQHSLQKDMCSWLSTHPLLLDYSKYETRFYEKYVQEAITRTDVPYLERFSQSLIYGSEDFLRRFPELS